MEKLQGLITSQKHFELDICEDVFKNYFKENITYDRKKWEYFYIYQMLYLSGMVKNDKKGFGFGCGEELIVPVLAKQNCKLICTDQSLEDAKLTGWAIANKKSYISKIRKFSQNLFHLINSKMPESKKNQFPNQYCYNLESFRKFTPRICDFEDLEKNVEVKVCNMNNIDEKYLTNDFDFIWSCCAFEHLGNIQKGINFVINSLNCLKPGGIAVHTTEINIDSLSEDFNGQTLENKNLVLFRKSDFLILDKKLKALGHHLYPIDYSTGSMVVDKFIDLPPYTVNSIFPTHLKLKVGQYTTSCIGIVIRKSKK